MKCSGVRHLLSAYLDGELDQGEELMVKQHTRRCPACADELNALRQTIALCASLEEVEVPADFRAGLRARLVALGPPVAVAPVAPRKAPDWRKNAGRWALPAAAAAAFVVAIGVGPYMTDLLSPPARPPVQETATGGNVQNPPSVPETTPSSMATNPVGAVKEPVVANVPEVGQNPTNVTNAPSADAPKDIPSQPGPKVATVDPSRGTAGIASLQSPADATSVADPQYALSTAVHIGLQGGVAAALADVTALAEQSGGTVVADGSSFDSERGRQSGIMVSLPATNLDGFLASLQALGVVTNGEMSRYDYGLGIEQRHATIAQRRRDLENVDGADTRAQAYRQSLQEEIAKLEEELALMVQRVETATVEVTLEEQVAQ